MLRGLNIKFIHSNLIDKNNFIHKK